MEQRGDSGSLQNGEEGELVPGTSDHRRFSDFLSHEEDIKKSTRGMNYIQKHYQELESILLDEMPDFQEFINLYGMVVINDFELHQSDGDMEGESLGMGVYLAPSIMNHSCRPNAEIEIVGKRLRVKSLVDIDELDVSKVFISYFPIQDESRSKRRDYLKKYFFFDCECEKCSEES